MQWRDFSNPPPLRGLVIATIEQDPYAGQAGLHYIPLKDIVVTPGFNPRADVHKADIATLTKSIEHRGLLQPLVVTPNGSDTTYSLVDGNRRYNVLVDLGFDKAPCLVRSRTDEVEQLIDAVTANAQRVNLNIVEEARAFKRMRDGGKPAKQIAAELGVAQKLVTQRLGMLVLPDTVLTLIAGGQLAPGHVPTLVEMAKVSPNLALGVATTVVQRNISASRFAQGPFDQVGRGHVPELGVWIVGEQPLIAVGSVKDGLDDADKGRLLQIRDLTGADPIGVPVDLDAAIAYGCVYSPPENEDSPWNAKWAVCDPDWVLGAVKASIAALLEQAVKREASKPASAPAAEGSDDDLPVVASEEQVKEAKREERKAELAERVRSHAVNLNLGAELFTGLAAVELTRDAALLLARLVVRDDARDLYLSGLRFCDPTVAKQVDVKDKPSKVEYELVERDDQAAQVWAFIERGDTGEAVIGRTLQVLAMAALCDQSTVAVSSRPGRPAFVSDFRHTLADLLGAKLPVPIRERLDAEAEDQAKQQAEREAWKAKRDAQIAADAEAEDASLTAITAATDTVEKAKLARAHIDRWGDPDDALVGLLEGTEFDYADIDYDDDDAERVAGHQPLE